MLGIADSSAIRMNNPPGISTSTMMKSSGETGSAGGQLAGRDANAGETPVTISSAGARTRARTTARERGKRGFVTDDRVSKPGLRRAIPSG
jgi:hypothetical protein